jgi:signal transduction histidine kinase
MNPSLDQVAAFVRQHTHDLRNDLTGIELDAVLLTSVFPDGEGPEIVNRMRTQIRKMASGLQCLAANFTDSKLVRVPVAACELFRLLEIHTLPNGPEISWTNSLDNSRVNVDVNSVARVFKELLANAVKFGDGSPLAVNAAVGAGNVVFSLLESKAQAVVPEGWGRTPFASIKRGSYGLGLWKADRIVQANGGSASRTCRDGKLITTLSFPVV